MLVFFFFFFKKEIISYRIVGGIFKQSVIGIEQLTRE